MKRNKSFAELMEKLEYHNNINSKETRKRMEILVDELEARENLKHFSFKKIDKRRLFLGMMIFIVVICGLFNITEATPAYYGGLVFFLVGLAIGYSIPVFGIIFFFSHGMTGLAFMLLPTLSDVLSNPALTDGSTTFIFIYIGIIVFLIIAGIISSVVYNLSNNIRKIPNMIFIPTGLFTLAIFLSSIAVYVFPLLNKISI